MKFCSISSVLLFIGLSACSDGSQEAQTQSAAKTPKAVCETATNKEEKSPLFDKLKSEGKIECKISTLKRVCD